MYDSVRIPIPVRRFLRLGWALALFGIASCQPILEGEQFALPGQQIRLTLLHTSDLHSRLLPYDFNPLKTDTDLGLIPEAGPFGGATRMAAIVKRERKNAGRVLHLDSGDSFQGAPIFNVNLGEAEYKFLSLMGVDAAVIGNHEFDAGALNFTRQLRDAARFPVLAANYVWEPQSSATSNQTQNYTEPYVVKNVQGLKVGIIGLGNIGSLNSLIEQPNSLQIVPVEQNEIVRAYVDLLRPTVDLMMVVSHAGLTEDQDLIEGYEAFYEWATAKKFVAREKLPWRVIEWFGPENEDTSVVRVAIPGIAGINVILGGHLHIVLNPPQLLTDPDGRKVILSHGGAFSKYVNRLDLALDIPKNRATGASISSFDFKVFPIDSVWCDDAARASYKSKFWAPGEYAKDEQTIAAVEACKKQEDKLTLELLLPYVLTLDNKIPLTSLFAYAPTDIARRNSSTGGDSPLGNITADSMRRRRGVEAELAITNSLGIRDNLYAGPLTTESMFNVFPFENTINVMFLSGRELLEVLDFITERSSGRGCVAQSQVSGVRFTMDCAQSQLNALRLPCKVGGDGQDCPQSDRLGRAAWQCLNEASGSSGRCWAHPSEDISINGQPLDLNATYRVAVNDFIARGGSGFLVLKRNTTRVETGISLRDSLIGYMQTFCSCDDLKANKTDVFGNLVSQVNGRPCGTQDPNTPTRFVVDPQVQGFCASANAFQAALDESESGCSCANAFRKDKQKCGGDIDAKLSACLTQLPDGPSLGNCSCKEALQGAPVCGYVPFTTRNFCESPARMPVAFGVEDGRISRRIK